MTLYKINELKYPIKKHSLQECLKKKIEPNYNKTIYNKTHPL